MSKLLDKLNQITKASPQPIGFRTTPLAPPKTRMLLIARLTQANSVDQMTEYITGADAVLLTKLNLATKDLEKIARAIPDIPWGFWVEPGNREKIKPIIEAGGDFLVFPVNAALTLPEEEKVSRILQVEPSLNEGLFRTINVIPVDAVLIASGPEEDYSLTWHRLMLLQHFADLLTKPLLVSLPSSVTAEELQILWETGVTGLVVETGPGQTKTLKELRQTIDELTFPPRKQRKIEALLPYSGPESSAIETEEEEEE